MEEGHREVQSLDVIRSFHCQINHEPAKSRITGVLLQVLDGFQVFRKQPLVVKQAPARYALYTRCESVTIEVTVD